MESTISIKAPKTDALMGGKGYHKKTGSTRKASAGNKDNAKNETVERGEEREEKTDTRRYLQERGRTRKRRKKVGSNSSHPYLKKGFWIVVRRWGGKVGSLTLGDDLHVELFGK